MPDQILTVAAAASIPWRWPHFRPAELACKHCGKVRVVPEFLDRLEYLRTAYGRPMIVSSAYRCSQHNQSVSSTGPNGPHTTGRAIDIAVSGKDAHWLLSLALAQGFIGVGVNQKGAGRFVHLDMSATHPRPSVWSY